IWLNSEGDLVEEQQLMEVAFVACLPGRTAAAVELSALLEQIRNNWQATIEECPISCQVASYNRRVSDQPPSEYYMEVTSMGSVIARSGKKLHSQIFEKPICTSNAYNEQFRYSLGSKIISYRGRKKKLKPTTVHK
ncbi:hypothetical protein M8C21_023710, partial [Ambrosia artemisiifolia]